MIEQTTEKAQAKRSAKTQPKLSFSDDIEEESDDEASGADESSTLGSRKRSFSMSSATEQRWKGDADRQRKDKKTGTLSMNPTSVGGTKTIIDDDDLRKQQASKRPTLKFYASAEQGKRAKMEDDYIIVDDLRAEIGGAQPQGLAPDDRLPFFGIYDGHGGRLAADFIKSRLHNNLRNQPAYRESDFAAALRAAFLQTDKEFLVKARKEGLADGCTALCIINHGTRFVVANVGDTRAVLARVTRGDTSVDELGRTRTGTTVAERISTDHKPDSAAERQRIQRLGGTIIFRGVYRVAGTVALAVSRAFGDAQVKDGSDSSVITAEPSLSTVELTHDHSFCILATDGLWDVVSDEEAVLVVKEHAEKNNGNFSGTAKALTKIAIDERGSADNTTVIVLQLIWPNTK